MQRRKFIASAAGALLAAPVLPAFAAIDLEPHLYPTAVRVKPEFVPGTIHVVPQAHFLYWITAPRQAIRYGVGVGRAGLEFQGSAIIQRKAEWPNWRPTDEMIARDPGTYKKYENGVPGGPSNPLGSRALYLYQNGRDTYYRIHGTTAPRSIGRSVSNGCIRMINAHVEDLYARVPTGTEVFVY